MFKRITVFGHYTYNETNFNRDSYSLLWHLESTEARNTLKLSAKSDNHSVFTVLHNLSSKIKEFWITILLRETVTFLQIQWQYLIYVEAYI